MKVLAIVGLVAWLASGPALAECVEPLDGPHVPDGATATREEMVAAQNAIKAYNIVVKEFTDCVALHEVSSARGNRAVDKLTVIADRFNVEMHTFKKKAGA
jgi:hypothetical protein